MSMNLKLRLERLCDSRSWVKLYFGDNTSVMGRVLRLGHDYIEIESYGEADKPTSREYSRHLIPLSLIKMITIESSSFADAERHRLKYLAQTDVNQESLNELEK